MQDVATLGVVNVRYCGCIAVVKIEGKDGNISSLSQSSELLDQPEGGANALNISRYCMICIYVFGYVIEH